MIEKYFNRKEEIPVNSLKFGTLLFSEYYFHKSDEVSSYRLGKDENMVRAALSSLDGKGIYIHDNNGSILEFNKFFRDDINEIEIIMLLREFTNRSGYFIESWVDGHSDYDELHFLCQIALIEVSKYDPAASKLIRKELLYANRSFSRLKFSFPTRSNYLPLYYFGCFNFLDKEYLIQLNKE